MTTNWSFGKEQMEIEEKTKELKDLLASNLDGQHNVAIRTVKETINQCLFREEIHWRQNSRAV